ncbi:MAG: PocR ligand-binding domain-containing protein [Clostridium sp.]
MLNKNNLDFKDIIDITVLQDIQDKFGMITGVSFITVDFRGKPITKASNFCSFCNELRKFPEGLEICCKSDAHGGLEAAIRQKPYMYRCPAGLVDFSAPIIVQGQYIGAVLCGQVRTENDNLKNIFDIEQSKYIWADNPKLVEAYNQTTYIEYEKLEAIASLIYTVVNQLAEKSMAKLMEKEINNHNIKMAKDRKVILELEKELIESEFKTTQTQINPPFLFNMLNSIGRLALMEKAKKTEEVTYTLAELLRYTLKSTDKKVILQEDIENLLRYLKIQSVRFGDKIKYNVEIEDEVKKVKIPAMILQPFIENAIIHGIQPKKTKGLVRISARRIENDAVITIEDDGVGIGKNKLKSLLNSRKANSNDSESTSTEMGICNITDRMISYYGE